MRECLRCGGSAYRDYAYGCEHDFGEPETTLVESINIGNGERAFRCCARGPAGREYGIHLLADQAVLLAREAYREKARSAAEQARALASITPESLEREKRKAYQAAGEAFVASRAMSKGELVTQAEPRRATGHPPLDPASPITKEPAIEVGQRYRYRDPSVVDPPRARVMRPLGAPGLWALRWTSLSGRQWETTWTSDQIVEILERM